MNKEYDTRFRYMGPNGLGTEVFINTQTKEVWFTNYAKDYMETVFGKKQSATWQDFKDFCESRCWERSRRDLRELLARLDIYEYNPMKVLFKTNGRTYEYPYYLEILRWEGNYEWDR